MRLLAVRLQNFNSLSREHVVRFDEAPLSAAGVGFDHGAEGRGKIDVAKSRIKMGRI
jgi:hypothetical protein